MAKMINIEDLKPLLSGVLSEENETAFLEGLMEKTVDYDEEAIQGRIDEAVNTARGEAQAEYSKKLHDMFFGDGDKVAEVATDDNVTNPEEETVNDVQTVSIDALLFDEHND